MTWEDDFLVMIAEDDGVLDRLCVYDERHKLRHWSPSFQRFCTEIHPKSDSDLPHSNSKLTCQLASGSANESLVLLNFNRMNMEDSFRSQSR